MIIQVSVAGPPSLLEAEDLKTLKVTMPTRLSDADARIGLEPAGALDGEHVWLSSDWLELQGPDRAEWRDGLQAMLGYAASKGWTDEAGRVRAHIERN